MVCWRFRQPVFLAAMIIWLCSCSFVFSPTLVKYIKYPVQRGDTLYTIGQRFNVDHDEIAEANDIDDPRGLTVGQIIKIPYHGQSLARNERQPGGSTSSAHGSGSLPKPNNHSSRSVRLSDARIYVGKLAWPVRGASINSEFGWRWLSFHEGVDLAAPEGTPIHAAHDGVVVYSGSGLRGYGNLVIIQGSHGIMTVYGHNRKNLADRGERVSKGAVIAQLGQSGKATGPHLHFEIRIKDESGKNSAVDPLTFYPDYGGG